MPIMFQHTAARRRLRLSGGDVGLSVCFNTQPPEGGWQKSKNTNVNSQVSTHSRPKAADEGLSVATEGILFQHTAARRRLSSQGTVIKEIDSFNTQPPEGGCWAASHIGDHENVSTHSRPKAAESSQSLSSTLKMFQHTAARRRLD